MERCHIARKWKSPSTGSRLLSYSYMINISGSAKRETKQATFRLWPCRFSYSTKGQVPDSRSETAPLHCVHVCNPTIEAAGETGNRFWNARSCKERKLFRAIVANNHAIARCRNRRMGQGYVALSKVGRLCNVALLWLSWEHDTVHTKASEASRHFVRSSSTCGRAPSHVVFRPAWN